MIKQFMLQICPFKNPRWQQPKHTAPSIHLSVHFLPLILAWVLGAGH